jgi:hypothetical protein
MEWMAFAYSLKSKPKTVNHTMLPDRINAIVRTGRMEAAALPQPGADRFLVAFDQQDQTLCG